MILKLEHDPSQNDIEVVITYPEKNRTVNRIVTLVKSVDTQITCYTDDNTAKLVNASNVYYIESVDKKTFVHCEKENYMVRSPLYSIYEKLSDKGFVQVSKYCILNINRLDKIKPLFNSRMEAVLSNGISLCVTRKYLEDIKRILQECE